MTTVGIDTGTGALPGAVDGAAPGGWVHPIGVALDRMAAGLDTAAAGSEAWSLTDDDLTAALVECEVLAARQTALMLSLVREADDRDLGRRSGAASTMSWLRHRLRLRSGDAKARVDLAHRLPGIGGDSDGEAAGEPVDWAANVSSRPGRGAMPATATALREGAVSADHAAVIARVMKRIPTGVDDHDVARAEVDLAGYAREYDPGTLEKLGDYLLHVITPDTLADEESRNEDRRELRFNENTGTIRGRLDREALAQLRSALDPLAKPCPSSDGTPDPRSPSRRMADALVELARRACDTGTLPGARGARPHLSVIVDLNTLLHGDDAGSSVFGIPGGTAVNGAGCGVAPGELAWGGPISAEAVRRIACDAGISRIITDPNGVPLDVGREYRTVTPGMYVALVARDGGCAFPGCTRPAAWTEAHHIVHWVDGGETSLDNQVLLCGFHHRQIHHHGWTVRLNPQDRLPEFIPPRWIDPDQTAQRNTTPRHHRQRSP